MCVIDGHRLNGGSFFSGGTSRVGVVQVCNERTRRKRDKKKKNRIRFNSLKNRSAGRLVEHGLARRPDGDHRRIYCCATLVPKRVSCRLFRNNTSARAPRGNIFIINFPPLYTPGHSGSSIGAVCYDTRRSFGTQR